MWKNLIAVGVLITVMTPIVKSGVDLVNSTESKFQTIFEKSYAVPVEEEVEQKNEG